MKNQDLVYKDECYRIVGILFQVYKELGGNLREQDYQKAIAIVLAEEGIKFIEQLPIKIYFRGKFIGIARADFQVEIGEAKIILEIKKKENFGYKNIKQTNEYIKAEKVKLGILANFTTSGVIYKRIVNITPQPLTTR